MPQKFNPNSYTQDRADLLDEYNAQQDKLTSSPTAYSTAGADLSPSVSDLKANAGLVGLQNQIGALDSANQKARWYGTSSGQGETAKKENTGFLSSVFNVFNKPLMWSIGAGEWLTGTNPKKGQSLFKAMDYNANVAKELYGDVFKKMGLPPPIANLLGLGADITMDPFNIATLGLESTVARGAYGLYKGTQETGKITEGLKLAKSGIVSALGKDFLWLENLIPGMSGAAKKIVTAQRVLAEPEKYASGVAKATKIMEESGGIIMEYKKKIYQLAQKVGQEDKLFNVGAKYNPLEMVGRTIAAPIEDAFKVREPLNSTTGKTVGSFVERAVKKIMGEEKGTDFITKVKYSSTVDAAFRKMMDAIPGIQEQVLNIGKEVPRIDKFGVKSSKVLTFDDIVMDNLDAISKYSKERGLNPIDPNKIGQTPRDVMMGKVEEWLKNSSDIANTAGDSTRITDPDKLAQEMEDLSQTIGDMRRIIKDKIDFSKGLTGIEWYDTRAKKLSDWIKSFKRTGQIRTDLPEEVEAGIRKAVADKKMTEAEAVNEIYRKQYLLKNRTDGEKVLDFLNGADSMFKLSKVAMGTASIINAYIGNPFMYKALGGNLSFEYFSSIYRALRLQFGRATPEDIYSMFFEGDGIRSFLYDRNATTRSYLGIDIRELKDEFFAKYFAREGGSGVFNATRVKINQGFEKLLDVGKAAFEAQVNVIKEARRAYEAGEVPLEVLNKIQVPFTQDRLRAMEYVGGERKVAFDTPSGAYADLLSGENVFTRFLTQVERDAKNGDASSKMLNFIFNTYPKIFQASDVSSKIGTFLHIVNNGLDAAELRVIGRSMGKSFDMRNVKEGGAIVSTEMRNGETYYKLTPDLAMEIGQEAYMNYAAMPAFVKMMKSVPILRSPFFSFSYAMLPKFGKALIHNPSFFNKIYFAERELSAEKGPIERENLKSKYYSWFDAPGIVRLPDFPFFQSNPAYLNLTSINPFESMSLTGEDARVYGTGFADKLVAMSDKLGLFQHPVFRTLLDFLIIPSIQTKGTPVQGAFGQPLYPLNATKMEKVKAAALAVVDAYTPSMLAGPIALGATVGSAALPETSRQALGQNLPLYFSRKIYHAARGETPLGIDSKNASAWLSLLGAFGFRINTMDLSFTPKEIKAKINK